MDVSEEDEVDEDGLRKGQEHGNDDSKGTSQMSQDEDQDEVDVMAKSVPSLWDRLAQSVDWPNRLRRCLLLAALACILRPTNILIWICIACFALLRTSTQGKMMSLPWEGAQIWIHLTSLSLLPATKRERITLLREVALCGYAFSKISLTTVILTARHRSLILLLSTLIDRLYYEQWTFPPFRFLYFNIAQSLAVFYGRNDWHYYLSQGYPLLLTTFLPFGVIGIYQSLFPPDLPPPYSNSTPPTKTIKYQLAATAVLVPFLLSFISHKEVRFIYPLLPLLHILAAAPFTTFFLPAVSPAIPRSSQFQPKRFILGLLVLVNITIAILTTTSHQTAPLTVMTYLRDQHAKNYLSQPPSGFLAPAPSTMTVGFLMPCHSTPWRSHLVYPSIKAWALTCEPPINLNGSARASYLDEADQFYANPTTFLAKTLGAPPKIKKKTGSWLGWFGSRRKAKGDFGREDMIAAEAWDGREGRKTWPEYLVFFEQMEPTMREVLEGSAYSDCWRGWNSWGHDDWRRKGDVIVWCLRKQGAERKRRALLW